MTAELARDTVLAGKFRIEVMELLEGETLGELLTKRGSLDVSLAIELVSQAAEGTEAAHRAGIIHRDLKPDNLFIMQLDGAPFVKLLDFGVSKFTTELTAGKRGTRAGAACGTPAYMAPEQLKGDATLDGRADVFALGVVLFECLTGALPFDAPSVEGMAARLLAGEPTRIDVLRPELPPELAAVVHRAIAQAPKNERPLSPVRQKPRPSAPIPPSAAPATPQRTRAQDLGLAEENPFQ